MPPKRRRAASHDTVATDADTAAAAGAGVAFSSTPTSSSSRTRSRSAAPKKAKSNATGADAVDDAAANCTDTTADRHVTEVDATSTRRSNAAFRAAWSDPSSRSSPSHSQSTVQTRHRRPSKQSPTAGRTEAVPTDDGRIDTAGEEHATAAADSTSRVIAADVDMTPMMEEQQATGADTAAAASTSVAAGTTAATTSFIAVAAPLAAAASTSKAKAKAKSKSKRKTVAASSTPATAAAASTTAASDASAKSKSKSSGRLAAVEVQSIMQMLDAKSLLLLARTSTKMLDGASSDVAWKHQPPFPVRFDEDHRHAADDIEQSLIRFAPGVDVQWHNKTGSRNFYLLRLLQISHIRGLTVHHQDDLWADDVRMLCASKAMRSIESLRFRPNGGEHTHHGHASDVMTLAAKHFKQLHTLEFHTCFDFPPNYMELSKLTNLTSLGIRSAYDLDPRVRITGDQCFLIASQLPPLVTQLTLFRPNLTCDQFADFCSTPSIARLKKLTLERYDSIVHTPPMTSDAQSACITAAWSSMVSLEELHLFDLIGSMTPGFLLLQLAAHAPHLRSIHLSVFDAHEVPALSHLELLRATASRSQIQLRITYNKFAAPSVQALVKQINSTWPDFQCRCIELDPNATVYADSHLERLKRIGRGAFIW